MGEVASDGDADDGVFRGEPTVSRLEAMVLQPDERAECTADVVALAAGGAEVTAFDAGELFEPAMILLDRPGEFREDEPGRIVPAEVVGGLMCRVAVVATTRNTLTSPKAGTRAASVVEATRGEPIKNWMDASSVARAGFVRPDFTRCQRIARDQIKPTA